MMAEKKILLLLGPSAAGKSTLIAEVSRLDRRFIPIAAYTTRPPRPGERFRICVSDADFDVLRNRERLLLLNEVDGHRYGTPKRRVDETLRRGGLPVFDCPVVRLPEIEWEYTGLLFRVYIEPPSTESLRRRLGDGRDQGHNRFDTAIAELEALRRGDFDASIDARVVNLDGALAGAAQRICDLFDLASAEDWPDLDRLKLRNDRYRNARGGSAVILEIRCGRCGYRVALYPKDGHGGLHRLYLNRILAPRRYAVLDSRPDIQRPNDLPPVICAACGTLIGTPMRHADGRLAFRLVPGSFSKRPGHQLARWAPNPAQPEDLGRQ